MPTYSFAMSAMVSEPMVRAGFSHEEMLLPKRKAKPTKRCNFNCLATLLETLSGFAS